MFWLAALPAALSVLVLLLFVRERAWEVQARREAPRAPFPRDARLRLFLTAVGLFALGSSSDAFLLLRVQDLGVQAVAVPLVYFAFNLVYTAASGPAGVLADRLRRGRVGLVALCADLHRLRRGVPGVGAVRAVRRVHGLH
ncbi:hypothetical protein DEIPH_ctg139orf0205 [Deinococcus phoenicis]|uniref:MFS transporter n=1 Tax=Deinococcus phoenicis TaxID=1476583 RepID=A0A016QKQ6_9DEIO|nr:hypothetical protein DEIPH_ctg139orf0205 [Deinococcus phoenicis]